MTGKNKVIWSEGLFLKPQHFQQQERYIADLIDKRSRALHFYGWGILSLEIDTNQLGMGKFAISSARGVMPDGTPFNIPGDDAVPAAIDFKEGVVGKTVYLALPLQTFQQMWMMAQGMEGCFVTRAKSLMYLIKTAGLRPWLLCSLVKPVWRLSWR